MKEHNILLQDKEFTLFKGEQPTQADVLTAKNYLDESELKILNNLVSGYSDFAEIQAMKHNRRLPTPKLTSGIAWLSLRGIFGVGIIPICRMIQLDFDDKLS